MDRYLYRISTKQTDVWSNKKPKPVYVVASSKDGAKLWADASLAKGLSVSKITKLAKQVAGEVFTAS